MCVLVVLFGEVLVGVNSGDEFIGVLIWFLLIFKVFLIVVNNGVVLVVIGLLILDWVFFL